MKIADFGLMATVQRSLPNSSKRWRMYAASPSAAPHCLSYRTDCHLPTHLPPAVHTQCPANLLLAIAHNRELRSVSKHCTEPSESSCADVMCSVPAVRRLRTTLQVLHPPHTDQCSVSSLTCALPLYLTRDYPVSATHWGHP